MRQDTTPEPNDQHDDHDHQGIAPTEALVEISRARQMLEECETATEIKLLRDQAETIRQYLRRQHASHEQQNAAAELKLRAERKLGNVLAETVMPGGRRLRVETAGELHGAEPTLPEGISAIQSYRWRREALVPEPEFETWVAETRVNGELTSAALLRLGDTFVAKAEGCLDLAPGGQESAAESAAESGDAAFENRTLDSPGADDESTDDVYTRMVPLYVTVGTLPQFRKNLRTLGRAYGTANPTDTIVECLARAVAALAQDADV